MQMIEAIFAGLASMALAGTFKALRPRVKSRWSSWRESRAAATAARKQAREHEQRQRERNDKIAEATAQGRLVAVARSGRLPVEVTFSDGSLAHYFCGNWPAYRQALNSCQFDLQRTHLGNPPLII